MIDFVIGKPGDGKTMRAVGLMLEHWRREDARPVVANIRIVLPEAVVWLANNSRHGAQFWYDYLQTHYFYLPDEKTLQFFRYRGEQILTSETDVTHPGFGKIKEGKEETFPNYSLVKTGVVYYLDEVHIAFGARNWQASGNQVLHYLSQHRKLGDDIIAITQHPEQVDKQFRMLTQNYHVVKNGYRQKYFCFRLPQKFTVKTFSDVPRHGSVSFDKTSFALDPQVGRCYDTTAGVGVGSARAPELKRVKGLPLWTIFLALGVGVFALIYGANWLSSSFISYSGKQASAKISAAGKGKQTVPTAAKKGFEINTEKEGEEEKPRVLGVFIMDRHNASFLLENGREINARESGYRLSIVGKEVLVDGLPVPIIRRKTHEKNGEK